MHSVDLAVLLLRLGVGLTFAAHGTQKTLGWWGGPGRERWHGAVGSMGFRPVGLFALASMVAELGGGILLALGAATPLAVMMLVGMVVVIIFKVHWPKGFFNAKGGFEFPLSLAVGVIAIGIMGPGQVSLDRLAGLEPNATVRAAFLVVGVAGGLVTLAIPKLVAPRNDTSGPS